MEVEDERGTIEELSAIFSADNFPSEEEREENFTTNHDDLDLDIGTTFPILMIMFTATLPPQRKLLCIFIMKHMKVFSLIFRANIWYPGVYKHYFASFSYMKQNYYLSCIYLLFDGIINTH